MGQKQFQIEIFQLKEAYQKVLYWFFSFPNVETGLNELSFELKISKTTAKKIINVLLKEGFLEKKVYGKAWRIICSQNHPYILTRKIAFNLTMVYELYLEGLRDNILKIVPNPKSIILFGSYRKGDDTEKSDIDIAVEVSGSDSQKIVELGKISSFGYRKNVQVNLHIFSRKEIDINLFSNIANGIILEGFFEVKP